MTKRKGFGGYDLPDWAVKPQSDQPPPPAIPDLKPRISDGAIWWLAAIICFGLALFCTLGAVGGSSMAMALAILFFSLTGICATLRLVLLIAHKIELRLIDIQKALQS